MPIVSSSGSATTTHTTTSNRSGVAGRVYTPPSQIYEGTKGPNTSIEGL